MLALWKGIEGEWVAIGNGRWCLLPPHPSAAEGVVRTVPELRQWHARLTLVPVDATPTPASTVMSASEPAADPTGFDALIEAFTIFRRYGNPPFPTHCEHDELMIVGIDPDDVSDADRVRLDALGFDMGGDGDGFHSYLYGSA